MRTTPLLGLMMTVALANPIGTGAAQDLRICGPGGPEPAIREAARQFGAAHGTNSRLLTEAILFGLIECCCFATVVLYS